MRKTKPPRKNPRVERALKNFRDGFNCAQSVLSAYGPELGLAAKRGHRVSQSFGGGMARMAGTCGALTGGLMVIGLKYGKTEAKDEAAKEKNYALARHFFQKFKARHGHVTCLGLLGHNIGTARGMKALQKMNFHKDICPKYVKDAVLILDKIL